MSINIFLYIFCQSWQCWTSLEVRMTLYVGTEGVHEWAPGDLMWCPVNSKNGHLTNIVLFSTSATACILSYLPKSHVAMCRGCGQWRSYHCTMELMRGCPYYLRFWGTYAFHRLHMPTLPPPWLVLIVWYLTTVRKGKCDMINKLKLKCTAHLFNYTDDVVSKFQSIVVAIRLAWLVWMILVFIWNCSSVFDVTKGRSHYGPGGGYHHFAGRLQS